VTIEKKELKNKLKDMENELNEIKKENKTLY